MIQKRSPTKDSHPNQWDISSAGHISSGENSITSAAREVEEELGVKFNPEDFEYLFSLIQRAILNNGTFINNEFNDVYLLKTDLDLAKVKLQKEEVSEIKFIPFAELEKIINSGDENFVPHPQEYKKLFEELHRRYN